MRRPEALDRVFKAPSPWGLTRALPCGSMGGTRAGSLSNTGGVSLIHVAQGKLHSKIETRGDDAITRTDPDTAHNRAGDSDYQEKLPETCALCWATELSEAEATEAQLDG